MRHAYLLVSAVAAMSLHAGALSAQAQPEATIIALEASRDCATPTAAKKLSEAVAARVPNSRMVKTAEDAMFELRWKPHQGAACKVTLVAGEERSTLELAAGADEGAVRNAASRIAWLISANMPEPEPVEVPEPEGEPVAEPEPEANPKPEPEPEPDPAPEPVTEPDPEPIPQTQYRTVPLHASLIPWLEHPRGPGGDVVSTYSFNIVGYQAGLEGIEFGMALNIERDFAHGLQLSLGGNIVGGDVDGAQLALGFNWAGSVDGAQLSSGVNVATGPVDGLQASFANAAGDVAGVQLGLLNIGRKVDGLQVGLLNIARASDVSVGLVNINYGRPLYLSAWGDELGMFRLGLQHGSRYLHWIISGGVSPFGQGLASAGIGLGGHFPLGSLYLELDAMAHAVGALEISAGGVLSQLRLTLGLPLGDRFAVYGGVSANMLASEPIDSSGRVLSFADTSLATPVDGGGTADLWVWPGFFAGIRL